MLWAISVGAQCPNLENLCQGVELASHDDFWAKWNAADWVVAAFPVLPDSSLLRFADGVTSLEHPPVVEKQFGLQVLQVWKGPESLQTINVGTSWGYWLYYGVGDPLEYYWFLSDSCKLSVDEEFPGVYFIRFVDGEPMTYSCFGSGVYDFMWLQTEVGEPVAVDAQSWGSVKATFR